VLCLNVPRGTTPVSLHELRVPLVTVGASVPGISGVLVDDIEVGYSATRHLLELGHRRIAYLGHDPDDRYGFSVAADRARGYATALAEFGIDVDPDLIGMTGFAIEAGTAAMDRLWERTGADPDRRPTAVFAVSDEVAMGVLHSARRHGISVPDQLSVIGVDNHDMAYLFELTTIGQPVREQGRIAARMLLAHMQVDEPSAPRVVTLRPALIRRATTAPVPGG
jgi:LacI family repressor for deo operon, udp, cdd, tsx, nupC, and nupG